MEHFNPVDNKNTIKVVHDFKRQILEIPALIRVMNNYYYKIQNQLKTNQREKLHSISIETLGSDLVHKKDSFKFPDSIILFEAWMNLGYKALYPRSALHYKFPGLVKGEKTRHLFQFTFSTSRGFGFPIYFGPEFYGYILTYGKILEPILRWSHTVCHRANQAIFLVAKRYNIKRHHPGEFESIIISEYQNNLYKGVDTLLHGYFTKDPKKIGKFNSLSEVLQNITFSYSIGDHAMSIELNPPNIIKRIPLITYERIVREYKVDFYTYVTKLISFNKLLRKKILLYKIQRKNLKSELSRLNKFKLFFSKSKRFRSSALKLSKKLFEIEKLNLYIHVMSKIIELIWTTPLTTHTSHNLMINEKRYIFQDKKNKDILMKESIDSIFLLYIQYYEGKYNFTFEEKEVLNVITKLKEEMAKIWFNFKEKQFNFALKQLHKISALPIADNNYNAVISEILDNLIPIFSIYEIFNRSLSESVYPESVPQTKRFGAYIASFLTSRYNPFGVNLMHLFNRLAFYNWSYFIKRNRLNLNKFYKFILRLPIWKYVPQEIKVKVLKL